MKLYDQKEHNLDEILAYFKREILCWGQLPSLCKIQIGKHSVGMEDQTWVRYKARVGGKTGTKKFIQSFFSALVLENTVLKELLLQLLNLDSVLVAYYALVQVICFEKRNIVCFASWCSFLISRKDSQLALLYVRDL